MKNVYYLIPIGEFKCLPVIRNYFFGILIKEKPIWRGEPGSEYFSEYSVCDNEELGEKQIALCIEHFRKEKLNKINYRWMNTNSQVRYTRKIPPFKYYKG